MKSGKLTSMMAPSKRANRVFIPAKIRSMCSHTIRPEVALYLLRWRPAAKSRAMAMTLRLQALDCILKLRSLFLILSGAHWNG